MSDSLEKLITEINQKFSKVEYLRKKASQLKIKKAVHSKTKKEVPIALCDRGGLVLVLAEYKLEHPEADMESIGSTLSVSVEEKPDLAVKPDLNTTVETSSENMNETTSDTTVETKSDIAVEKKVETEPTPDTTTKELTDYEAELKQIGERYYEGFGEITGIRTYANDQMQQVQAGIRKLDPRLFATVAKFKEEIVSLTEDMSSDGKLNESSAINNRGFIFKNIEKFVKDESKTFTLEQVVGDKKFITNFLQDAYDAFKSGVIASFSQIARAKRENQGNNFIARKISAPHANVLPLIQWAVTRLKNPPKEAKYWREVALAVMIITGRRPAEILGTGVFKAVDSTYIKFYGQLKKKGKTDVNDETTYRLPCIGDTAIEVEYAIQWLQTYNKREIPKSRSLEDKQKAAKKAHDRFSRYLSEIANEIMSEKLVLANGATWKLEGELDRIKPYLARQIYLQTLSQIPSQKEGMSFSKDLALTYYAGHFVSVDGKDANAENYQADINIDDINEIQKFWNWTIDVTAEEIASIRLK